MRAKDKTAKEKVVETLQQKGKVWGCKFNGQIQNFRV